MPILASHNQLLDILSEEDRQHLVAQAETVSLQSLEELYPADGQIDSVYFPLTLVASILINAGQGNEFEIAIIGNEGMLGSSVVLGVLRPVGRTLVQVHGMALKLSVEALRVHMEQQPMLWAVLTRYLDALLRQIAQACACNQLHSIEERCARWLLMTQDRVGGDTFVVTQQSLAEVMGVRRATVNHVLAGLRRAGLLAYVRGRMQILDRPGLEAISCLCYTLIGAEYQRLQADLTNS
jgi:CRP-like cAMP-binding protein